ncbi:MAG: hypothetical protein EPO21_15650 [Chloroflexota bacterium]|nr:MAG: hypothetical protein EPO21_15650 [Chloroflexota bacterium]
MREILQMLPVRCALAEAVVNEAIYVLRGGNGDDAAEQEPVDLRPFTAAGLVEVWRPEKEAEYADFVNFAVDIDDGEAITCALALHRSGAVVTDDRKTLRILSIRASQLRVFTTTQVVKLWAESARVDKAVLRATLLDIQTRARFVPGKQDPLLDWWKDVFQQ